MLTRRTTVAALLATAGALLPGSPRAHDRVPRRGVEPEPAAPAVDRPDGAPAPADRSIGDFFVAHVALDHDGFFDHRHAGTAVFERMADGGWAMTPLMDLKDGLDRASRLEQATYDAGVRITAGYDRPLAINGRLEA